MNTYRRILPNRSGVDKHCFARQTPPRMPDINELSIEQIEKVLKLRKELEAVFVKPAQKQVKQLRKQAEKPAGEAKPKRKGMSKAGRAKLAAAAKARWAKAKKAGKTSL